MSVLIVEDDTAQAHYLGALLTRIERDSKDNILKTIQTERDE